MPFYPGAPPLTEANTDILQAILLALIASGNGITTQKADVLLANDLISMSDQLDLTTP